jgi:hypothetical protein
VIGSTPTRVFQQYIYPIQIGPNASIENMHLSIYTSTLTGHVENIRATRLIVREVAAFPGGDLYSPTFFTGGSLTTNIANKTRFFSGFTSENISASAVTFTINFQSGAECYGDVEVLTGDVQSVAINGTITLAGTNDQTLRMGSTAISLLADKTAGSVTTLSGVFEISGELGGTLDNHTALNVATGQTLTCQEYIDRPTATLTGNGTLKTAKITRA